MKRLLCILLLLALLSGCGGGEITPTQTAPLATEPVVETTEAPTETTEPVETEPPVPALLQNAQPWGDGTLLELPFTIDTAAAEIILNPFGDDLLIGLRHYEPTGMSALSLYLLDGNTLEIKHEYHQDVTEWLTPQVQSDRIIIVEDYIGVLTILDQELNQVARYETGTTWNESMTMGYGDLVYINYDNRLVERNLATGEEREVWSDGTTLYTNGTYLHGMSVGWYVHENRRWEVGFLNFVTGEVEKQPFRGHFDFSERYGDLWLCRRFSDGRDARLGNGDQAWDIYITEGTLNLTQDAFLMNDRGGEMSMYDLSGNHLSTCNISYSAWHYCEYRPIWREDLNGWLMLAINTEDGSPHLLYWPMGVGESDDLTLNEVDLTITAEMEMAQLAQQAKALGDEFSIEILIGGDCTTDFVDFTADSQMDPEVVEKQLGILEEVLRSFPEGMVPQMMTYDMEQIQIHLIRNLMAKPHFGTGGSYGGFVYQEYGTGTYIMAVDTNTEQKATYYHEFSHIIEDYVWRDSINRDDALYSWDGWMAGNPEGFDYTWDSANYVDLTDELSGWFMDNYALINDKEDRARLFEYACQPDYDWIWQNKPGALEKMRYYADCIRDAFDTEGWDDVTIWERVLQ